MPWIASTSSTVAVGDRVHRAEVPRDLLRRGLADVRRCRARTAAATAAAPSTPAIAATSCSALFSAKRSSSTSCSASSVVEVRGVVHQPRVDELRDARVRQSANVHRAARREVHEALELPPGTVEVRAVEHAELRARHELRAARRTVRRRHVRRRRMLRVALVGTGPMICGITSPARFTCTTSPTRRSLRATRSKLCSVASFTVVPPISTGSSTAYGIDRSRAPDVHLDRRAASSRRCPARTCARSRSAARVRRRRRARARARARRP